MRKVIKPRNLKNKRTARNESKKSTLDNRSVARKILEGLRDKPLRISKNTSRMFDIVEGKFVTLTEAAHISLKEWENRLDNMYGKYNLDIQDNGEGDYVAQFRRGSATVGVYSADGSSAIKTVQGNYLTFDVE